MTGCLGELLAPTVAPAEQTPQVPASIQPPSVACSFRSSFSQPKAVAKVTHPSSQLPPQLMDILPAVWQAEQPINIINKKPETSHHLGTSGF